MRLFQKHLCAIAMSIWAVSAGYAAPLVEPTLHIKQAGGSGHVALTLDACGGQTDETDSLGTCRQ